MIILNSKNKDADLEFLIEGERKVLFCLSFKCLLIQLFERDVLDKMNFRAIINLIFRKYSLHYNLYNFLISQWYQPSFVLMHQWKSKIFLFSNFNLLVFHFLFFLVFHSVSFIFNIFPVLAPTSPVWTCWPVFFRLESFIQLKELFWWLILGHMIDSDGSSAYFRSIEIVNSQNSWPLILICQKGKTFWFSSDFITSKPQINNFSKLRENYCNISFIHLVIEISNKNIGAVILNKEKCTSLCQDPLPLILFFISFRLYLSIFFVVCI